MMLPSGVGGVANMATFDGGVLSIPTGSCCWRGWRRRHVFAWGRAAAVRSLGLVPEWRVWGRPATFDCATIVPPAAALAGVILGGGEFVGGRVSPIGAVIGALTLTLAASFLSFLKISPDWQIGAQGAILIIVLALRLVLNRREGGAAK